MSAENSFEHAVLDAEDQRQVDELNRLVEQQRRRNVVSRVDLRELRIMLYLCGSLMLLMCATYVFLSRADARLVTTYVNIVALVLAGWGFYRSYHSRRIEPAVRKTYARFFGMMTSFY